jgi:hypothetical protein
MIKLHVCHLIIACLPRAHFEGCDAKIIIKSRKILLYEIKRGTAKLNIGERRAREKNEISLMKS